MATTDPYAGLSDALALVFDAIAVAGKGLLKNPSTEQKRKLNRRIASLEAERADIAAKMDAIEDGNTGVKGPTEAQVRKIAALTGDVEAATRANITASSAIALSAKVLTLATKVADA